MRKFNEMKKKDITNLLIFGQENKLKVKKWPLIPT